jgi:predicted protein tyrosine phosphatase
MVVTIIGGQIYGEIKMLKSIFQEVAGWIRQTKILGFRTMLVWLWADICKAFTGAPLLSLSQLTPQLHLGGQYQQRGWSKLAERGITAVVNLREEFDDNHAGIAPSSYLYLPTVDEEAPTLTHLRRGITFIDTQLKSGGGVYVHCRSGVGRAATMMAAYLVSTDQTPEQAWRQIRQVRPFISPTPGQIAQVERLAARDYGILGTVDEKIGTSRSVRIIPVGTKP